MQSNEKIRDLVSVAQLIQPTAFWEEAVAVVLSLGFFRQSYPRQQKHNLIALVKLKVLVCFMKKTSEAQKNGII